MRTYIRFSHLFIDIPALGKEFMCGEKKIDGLFTCFVTLGPVCWYLPSVFCDSLNKTNAIALYLWRVVIRSKVIWESVEIGHMGELLYDLGIWENRF